jgi:nitrous oxidase accessory protein NosD
MLMGCIALKDKMKGGYAVVKAMTSLMLTIFFLLASGTNAQMINILTVGPGESITDVINNASPGDIVEVESGTYYEDIEVNQPVILKGLDNPTLSNASPGSNIIDVKTAGVTITGFAIIGTSAAGILVNGSPDIIDIVGKPLVIYSNIYGNDIGLQNDLTEENTDAAVNFWGTNGMVPKKANLERQQAPMPTMM